MPLLLKWWRGLKKYDKSGMLQHPMILCLWQHMEGSVRDSASLGGLRATEERVCIGGHTAKNSSRWRAPPNTLVGVVNGSCAMNLSIQRHILPIATPNCSNNLTNIMRAADRVRRQWNAIDSGSSFSLLAANNTLPCEYHKTEINSPSESSHPS